MPQEGSSECIDCIRLHSCVCKKKIDFNYNASICMILAWKMHFTDSICNDQCHIMFQDLLNCLLVRGQRL